ncbi:dienelactone hydrolase family protein, partial [Staphylococcus warneri]
LNTNKVDHEMITYGNAPHAFTVYDTPAYRKDADEKSWSHFLSFLISLR